MRTVKWECDGIYFDALGKPGTDDTSTVFGYRRRWAPDAPIKLVFVEKAL